MKFGGSKSRAMGIHARDTSPTHEHAGRERPAPRAQQWHPCFEVQCFECATSTVSEASGPHDEPDTGDMVSPASARFGLSRAQPIHRQQRFTYGNWRRRACSTSLAAETVDVCRTAVHYKLSVWYREGVCCERSRRCMKPTPSALRGVQQAAEYIADEASPSRAYG